MSEIKRNIKCTNCNSEASVYIATDMGLSELLIHGKCPKCGNSLQINYTLIESAGTTAQGSATTQTAGSANNEQQINLDQSLFDPEFPAQSIKDLIEGE